jgi:hypothetical protein
MTKEEVNAFLNATVEKFREVVSEEMQMYYSMGKTISLKEIEDTLMAYETDEMPKMFNSGKIPQDKFRVFLRRYLRLWFNALVSKINELGENINELGEKINGAGLKYGTYAVLPASFTFGKFATKNENSEEFDVLEVSFSGSANAYSVNITNAVGDLGDTRIMIFNVPTGSTVNLVFSFGYMLVDGGELSLTSGIHVVSLLRASINIVNIAPYEE